MLQLGQKRNQAALDAITDDDNQLSVVEKIKKYRTPSAPKEKKSVRRVGNLKGGTPKLVIEVPPGPHVEEIYSDYEKSATPVAQWLGGLVNKGHDFSKRSPDLPDLEENSDYTLPSDSQQLESVSTTDLGTASGYTSSKTPPCPKSENLDEQETVQAELDAYINFQGQSIAPEAENCEADQAWTLLCVVLKPEDSSPNIEVAPSLEPNTELQVFAATPETQLDIELPCPVPENLTEQALAQAELNEYVETQAQNIAPESRQEVTSFPSADITYDTITLPEVGEDIPQEELTTQLHPLEDANNLLVDDVISVGQTSASDYPPAKPTDRYKIGWLLGDKAIANTIFKGFAEWCQGQLVSIKSVHDDGGAIQRVCVIRPDGAEYDSFGNWIEEVPGESIALPPLLPSPALETFFRVGDTGDDWDGEVVKLISQSNLYHRVSRLSDNTWMNIQHKFLQEISSESAATSLEALAEKVFSEFGLRLGDVIECPVENVTLRGTIVRLTKLGAFIDEGQPGHAWIQYHRLSKVQPEAVHSEAYTSVVVNDQAMETSATECELKPFVDFASLSDALKNATSWQEIEQLVQRDSSRFALAVKEWMPQEKEKLVNHLTNYIESDMDALNKHQIDWLNATSLEKSLKHLSYKVKNILSGLTSPWINGCQFVKVENFAKDSEEMWTFLDPTSLKEIKVCDREDFQVITF